MKSSKLLQRLIAILVWLFIWQLASMYVSQEMLLASPVSVAKTLLQLLCEASFWQRVLFSLSRVALGFGYAFFCGILLAALSGRFSAVRILLNPLMSVVKAAPVASYVILCLFFLPSRQLSTLISFLMALPIIYTNILSGLDSTDRKLLEMAHVFRVSFPRKIIYIYFSQLMPFLISACSLSLGMCWKAGIAAEVIGMPKGSIGEMLYQAKIFLDSPSLIAWTIVVIAVSFLFERAFLALLRRLSVAIEHR